MKGNTKMEMNEATVIEALQLLVDRDFAAPAPKVTAIESATGGYASAGVRLDVTLEAQEPQTSGGGTSHPRKEA